MSLSMFHAYVECALWASTGYASEDDSGTPMDDIDASLTPEALATMRADCEAFLEYLEEQGIDWSDVDTEQMGHDFWLTRNRHGAGFWDRGLGALGSLLTEAAHAFGPCDLFWDGADSIAIG